VENINQEIINEIIDRAKDGNRPSFIKINIDTLEALVLSGSEAAKDIYKELLKETDEPWTEEDEEDWQNGRKYIKEHLASQQNPCYNTPSETI
jgi:hypothetical protein